MCIGLADRVHRSLPQPIPTTSAFASRAPHVIVPCESVPMHRRSNRREIATSRDLPVGRHCVGSGGSTGHQLLCFRHVSERTSLKSQGVLHPRMARSPAVSRSDRLHEIVAAHSQSFAPCARRLQQTQTLERDPASGRPPCRGSARFALRLLPANTDRGCRHPSEISCQPLPQWFPPLPSCPLPN